MTETLKPWTPNTRITRDEIRIDDLFISFHSTLRMPDNKKTNALPPSMGRFPLFQIKNYANTLPSTMTAKGGVFFTMQQREAMWISFQCSRTYAIKIFVGGVNAISGEPVVETAATRLRRQEVLRTQSHTGLQDFAAAPHQKWLDGIAIKPGKVRQFVAMPMGSGHSVEAQVTGEETTGGLQFEVTRLDYPDASSAAAELYSYDPVVNKSSVNSDKYYCAPTPYGGDLPAPSAQNLFFSPTSRYSPESAQNTYSFPNAPLPEGNQLCENPRALYSEESLSKTTIAEAPPQAEMNLAPGGLIKQTIVPLPQRGDYHKTTTVIFNVQILNALTFQAVTGKQKPKAPTPAVDYVAHGMPLFSMHEEPTTIAGNFDRVKSVGEIDGIEEKDLGQVNMADALRGKKLGQSTGEPAKEADKEEAGMEEKEVENIGFFNRQASPTDLRYSWDIAEELRQQGTRLF